MADKTIPQLPELTTVADETLFPVDSGTQSFKATAPKVADYVRRTTPEIESTVNYLRNQALRQWKYKNSGVGTDVLTVCWSPELHCFAACGPGASSGGTSYMSLDISRFNGENWGVDTCQVETLNSICWAAGLSLFVAVGQGDGSDTNIVVTSPNADTWTTRIAAEDSTWNDVIWVEPHSRLIAVSRAGKIMTSENATSWTSRTAPEANQWRRLAYSPTLDRVVAVASSGTNRVMTSDDGGVSWTARPITANQWYDVQWCDELGVFVALSINGAFRVATSPDGITWTGQTTPTTYICASLAWSPELKLMLAIGNGLMYSTDGTDWKDVKGIPPDEDFWQDIIWVPELSRFVAVRGGGLNGVWVSGAYFDWEGYMAGID